MNYYFQYSIHIVAINIAQIFAKQMKIRRQGFSQPGRFSCTYTNAFKKTPRVYLTRQVFLHVTPEQQLITDRAPPLVENAECHILKRRQRFLILNSRPTIGYNNKWSLHKMLYAVIAIVLTRQIRISSSTDGQTSWNLYPLVHSG